MTTTLVGMFYMRDYGDTYSTGEVVAQLHTDAYLLKPDNWNDMPVAPPMEVMSIGDMAHAKIEGINVMQFFQTRDLMESYITYIDSPSSPAKVFSLVPKAKEE